MIATRKEEKVIDCFNNVWNRPFSEIIEAFYKQEPAALHQLCMRLRRNRSDDCQIAQEKLLQISEKKEEMETADKIFKTLLNNYNKLSTISDFKVASKEWQRKFIDVFLLIYLISENTVKIYDELEFYYLFAAANSYDMHSLHIRIDHVGIQCHFTDERKNIIATTNPNFLYLSAFMLDQGIDNVFSDDRHAIKFIRSEYNEIENKDPHAALIKYREAICAGSELALTGLAKMYAEGLAVEKDANFAVELYKLAISRGVIGAVPCESDDPRILFYSVMASGMHMTRQGAASSLMPSNTHMLKFIEMDWMIKINKTLPRVSYLLEKFRLFALKNPKGLFDALLDELPDSIKRLEMCLEGPEFKTVLNRKTTAYYEREKVVYGCTFFSTNLSHLVFSYETTEEKYYSGVSCLPTVPKELQTILDDFVPHL